MKRPNKSVLLLFFVVSLILYFYRYPKMLAFDADQEFYANQYIQIVKEHKFTLLGIETSIGGMFVGPLYTYVSSFIYWFSSGNPLGIFWVTLIFTSFQPSLTYYLFTKLKGRTVGLISGFLVLFSAALWNKAYAPSAINFLYPMGLVFFYVLLRTKEQKKYLFWLGIILAATLQIHFSLFFFFPIAIVVLVWQRLLSKKYLGNLLQILLAILISLSPLTIFDLRHRFFIANNLWRFIGQNAVPSHTNVFIGMTQVFSHILMPNPNILVYIFLMLVLIFFILNTRKDFEDKVISIIFAVSLLLFILYRGPKPDYFFYFLLAPFFFVASEFLYSLAKSKLLKWPMYLFLIYLAFQNLQFINSTLNHYNLFLKREVARYIKNQSQGKKVKISYDTDLGLAFGFDYLLKYEGVKIDNSNYEENYHIVIRNYPDYPGVQFREPGSPGSIKVVKLSKET